MGIYAAVLKINEFRQEERRFNDSRKLAASFIFEIPDALVSVPGTLAARQLIVQRATRYLDGLAQDAGGNSVLESELAAAYYRIGSLTFDVAKSLDLHQKTAGMGRRRDNLLRNS